MLSCPFMLVRQTATAVRTHRTDLRTSLPMSCQRFVGKVHHISFKANASTSSGHLDPQHFLWCVASSPDGCLPCLKAFLPFTGTLVCCGLTDCTGLTYVACTYSKHLQTDLMPQRENSRHAPSSPSLCKRSASGAYGSVSCESRYLACRRPHTASSVPESHSRRIVCEHLG